MLFELIKNLKDKNFECGVKLVHEYLDGKEYYEDSHVEDGRMDIDFHIKNEAGDYIMYTTTCKNVIDDEPLIDVENGNWSAVENGDHITN